MILESLPLCSLIIVHYNGISRVKSCLVSLEKLSYSNVEVILIDNGSTDGSLEFIRESFPEVKIFINSENNFAKALNLGISLAKGNYIGFLNNDVVVDSEWLGFLVNKLETSPEIGVVGGKILLKDGRINSAGVQELPDFYWQDLGFGEKDIGQYETEMHVKGLCWAAVLFRRQCLENVGAVDDDFVMYFEDVEYCKRCLIKGWKLLYLPQAIVYHEFGASSRGNKLTEYFCNRNRFLYLAKHEPYFLAKAINTSVFFITKQYHFLLEALFFAIKKLREHHPQDVVDEVLPALREKMTVLYENNTVDRLLSRLDVISKKRKLSIGIYDHGLHFIGGGQKYVATLAETLQHQFDITFIANKPVSLAEMQNWYGLDLSACKIKIIPLSYYEKRGMQTIDSSIVNEESENVFDAISKESQNYDVFINANQLEKVKPFSPISIFFCHFPNAFRGRYFAVDDYTFIITNSRFTTKWLQKRWELEPAFLLYPPVQMQGEKIPKENIILSVAQFEAGGTKKQLQMIEAFRHLQNQYPEIMQNWKLILAGGTLPNNSYLKNVQNQLKQDNSIELKLNCSREELKIIYSKASIFWHLCGLEEINPQRCEHFGMATVEAMQNYCFPVVANAGGHQETIEDKISGFLINNLDELCSYTHQLITNPQLLQNLQTAAFQRSQNFTKTQFQQKLNQFFDIIHQEYTTPQLPNPSQVSQYLNS